MRARGLLRCLLGAALLTLAGCSVLDGSFHECDRTADCPAGRACVQSYCVVVNCPTVYGAADAGDAIPLGAALPLTTPADVADTAQQVDLEAFVLALDEINQRGVGGRSFAVTTCDTGDDVTKLTATLSYLIDTKKVVAVLTSHSAQALAGLPLTVSKDVLMMSATATTPELTAFPDHVPGPEGDSVSLFWRTAPSDELQSQVIATQVLSMNPVPAKVGILYQDDPYGQALYASLFQALGSGRAQGFQFPLAGDASPALDQLNAYRPNLTVAIGFAANLVPLLDAAANEVNLEAGSGHRWFFTDGAKDPALLADATAAAQVEGAFGTAPAQGAGLAYTTFSQRFQTQYQADPAATSFTAHSYDAMYLLALGTAWAAGPAPALQGAITGPRIAEGLGHVSTGTEYQLTPELFTAASTSMEAHQGINVDGASGALDFDPKTGQAPSAIEIWQVQNHAFVTTGTVLPAAN